MFTLDILSQGVTFLPSELWGKTWKNQLKRGGQDCRWSQIILERGSRGPRVVRLPLVSEQGVLRGDFLSTGAESLILFYLFFLVQLAYRISVLRPELNPGHGSESAES